MRDQPHLLPRKANHRPLSPLDFLDRALEAHPDRLAVVWRDWSWTYAGLGAMVARLVAQLLAAGIGRRDVVSVMLTNRPEMLAAHFAVPLLGAILNSVNTRLDAAAVSYILEHSGSRIVVAEAATATVARAAAETVGVPLVVLADPRGHGDWDIAGPESDPGLPPDLLGNVDEEWQALGLNYTSGTTGHPKGVVYHHRGAYLNALGNVLALGLNRSSVYLWTLPMFHCNGWCHPWAVTAAGGTHVCLDRVDPAAVFAAIADQGVTHMACAPVVLYMLLSHPDRARRQEATTRVTIASGGAAPSVTLIAGMEELGFDFIHLYGLTESFGPASLCIVDEPLTPEAKAARLARQGVRHTTASRIAVLDDAGDPVLPDGASVGEVVLQGNTLMAGYWRDPEATEAAFASDMLHTGDLAVRHSNGDIEVRDRAKDVIISGGENISSLEVENALHQHPAVLLAAVVAAPDPKWGEVPYAFVELKPGEALEADDLQQFCREHLAHFKVPRHWAFEALPRTGTGKIQKFRLREVARARLRS